MIAKNLITNTVPPLKWSDTKNKAHSWMSELHIHHLPVVNGQTYIGLISEYVILDAINNEHFLSDFDLADTRPFVYAHNHIYDVLKVVNEQKLSAVPVLDEEENYIGLIILEDLLNHFARAKGMQEPGGIIVLEMKENDFVLSQIARIAESNNAKILSSYITTNRQSSLIEVTLKINRIDLSRILATYERYGYTIKASYQEDEYLEDLQEHYDSFMHYLSI